MKKNAEKVMLFVKGNESSHLYLLSKRLNSTYIACNRPSQLVNTHDLTAAVSTLPGKHASAWGGDGRALAQMMDLFYPS